jgi:DNA polymerase III epsilon subunit-like protein
MNRPRSIFTVETPLGQDVQSILMQHPEGLRVDELWRLLRREKGRHVNQENLRELLGNTRFFSLLPGDRYILASGERPSSENPTEENSTEQKPGTDFWDKPFISNVPLARENYVVFDLETTGTDPSIDKIIQIAALKVINGRPVAARNWYVNPGEIDIPYTLKITLGMADDPALEQAVKKAPPISEILPEFLSFIEELPLVAHNARFDGRFLTAALCTNDLPSKLVDNLELAILLHPNLPAHQLASISEALGLPVDSLGAEWAALNVESNFQGHNVSTETLHNAVTDVYVLFRIYSCLITELYHPGEVRKLLQDLLPEAFEWNTTYSGFNIDLLVDWSTHCDWSIKPNQSSSPNTVSSAAKLLTRYLSKRDLRPRNGQLDMQQLIVDAQATEQYTMIEAPTGTGKTLAYLTASVFTALKDGRRVALSTAYKNLQDQLLSEIKDLQNNGEVLFRSQLLKGV